MSSESVAIVPDRRKYDLESPASLNTTSLQLPPQIQNWIERQEYINKSHDQLAKFNFALTYANLIKTSQVGQKCKALQGDVSNLVQTVDGVEQSLEQQSKMVGNLENGLQAMRSTVEDQSQHVTVLQNMSENRHAEVNSLLRGLSEQMRMQQEAIDQQERLVAKLGDSKLKQDALVDVSSVVIAVVFSGSPIVSWPMQILEATSRTVTGSSRTHRRLMILINMLRFVIFCGLVQWIRRAAARTGLHSYVGGPEAYWTVVTGYVRCKMGLSLGSECESSDSAETSTEDV